MKTLSLGREGEDLAFKALKKEGYKIIDRNVTSPAGEIDLIAREGGAIVFVEVKTRSSARFGSPQAAVDLWKQRRLTRLAMEWLQRHRLTNSPARFDVVSIQLAQDGRIKVEILKNAFEAQE